MVSAVAALGYLCLAFAALHLSTFLDPQPQCGAGTGGTMTSAEAPLLYSAAAAAAEVLPPFAAVVVLFLAVALIYHHLMLMGRRVVAVPVDGGAGNGRRSVSALVIFVLCVSAGTLEFIVFGQAAGGGGGAGHGAQARALGLAALRALPSVATATFFLGMMLIIVAHVRAGGEGGGGTVAGAGAGDVPIQGLLRLLTKVAAGMAVALVGLIAMAVTLYDAKC